MKKQDQYRQLLKSNKSPKSVATFNKKSILVCVAMMFASELAEANPEGGQFVQGLGAISNAVGLTTIQQTTQQAIVNWQSFGSNAGEVIKFVQPSANAAILNRVVGNLPSNLNGLLEGNGRVYLVNPNGIVLGVNGMINVNSGFVASTQGVSDSAFMQGGALVFSGANIGNIQILGKINSAQGDIVIIAPKTEIAAGAELKAGQNIQLIAANEVQLSNGKFTVTPKLSDAGQLTVAGTLEVAKVQLEAHNNNLGALAINTTGTVRATGTQTNPDGSVTIMAYGDGGNIKVSGNITAYNNDVNKEGGRIIVGRNEETGALAKSADVSGATFTTNKGFVETSAKYLDFGGVNVQANNWLLDPYNITIGTTEATSIQNVLNGSGTTSVTVTTATAGLGSTGAGDGNVTINAGINKTAGGNSTLTLYADNGITLNNKIQGSSSNGVLNVNLTAKGGVAGGSATSYGVYVTGTGGIDTNGKVVIDSTTKYTGTWDYTKSALAMNAGSVIRGSDVDIKLKVDTPSGASYRVYGAFLQNAVTLEATAGNFAMDSKITNGANSINSSAILFGSGVGNAVDLKASGNVSLTADWTGNTGNGGGINLVDTKISAVGNILVDSKVNAPTVAAISTGNGGGGKGFSAASTGNGDVTFKANQGAIGLGALTTAIKGRNVTIDNTDSAISSPDANGLTTLTKGAGTSTKTDVAGVTISSNAGVPAIDATGNVNIAGVNSAGTQSGVVLNANSSIKGKNVTIDGTSLNANGVYSAAAITSNTGDIKITGISTSGSGTVISANVTSSKSIELSGTSSTTWGLGVQNRAIVSANGPISLTGTTGNGKDLGVLIWGGSIIQANAGTDYANGANAILIKGLTPANSTTTGRNVVINNATITNNSNNGDTYIYGQNSEIALDPGAVITNASTAGQIKILADNNAKINASQAITNVTPTAKITQNSDKGISIVSSGNGDILVPTVVNNGSGDVIIAAGSLKVAGDGSGGQVQTHNDSTVTQGGTGKLYVYSGRAGSTGVLSKLTGSFSELSLSGDMIDDSNNNPIKQNADSYVAYQTNDVRNTIANGANSQVMFREKVAVDTGSIANSAELASIYGANDHTHGSASATLLGDMKEALKNANSGNLITTTNGNTFKISKVAAIDDMTGSLQNAGYSTSGYLKAGSYNYNLAGSKYNTSLDAAKTKVTISKQLVVVNAAGNTVFYNGTQQTDTVTNSGLVTGDNVVIVGAGSGTHAGVYQSNLGLVGDDVGNYNPSFVDKPFTIQVPANYASSAPPTSTVLLTPITFGFGAVGGATAAGGEVEGSCDAWSQRAGAGSISVVSLLKPTYMGLRTAKTDTMDAMTGNQVTGLAADASDSPCASASLVNRQASL